MKQGATHLNECDTTPPRGCRWRIRSACTRVYSNGGNDFCVYTGKSVGSSRAGGCAGSRYPFLTSKERDVETGLDYFLARYYSATHGRFTSPDEFSGGPDELYSFVAHASENPTLYAETLNPQTLNKYQYGFNNPLRFVDPDGHDPVTAIMVVAKAAGVVKTTAVATKASVVANSTATAAGVKMGVEGAVEGVKKAGEATKYGVEQGVEATKEAFSRAAHGIEQTANTFQGRPTEPYNRRKHYGNTPTKGDRQATGGESTDHDPPLVKRYYEGDAKTGKKPGYQQTDAERKASAKDRTRMRPATKAEQRRQGGEMSDYSKKKKKKEFAIDK